MVPKQLHREGYSRLYWGSSVVQGALRKPTQLEENNFFLQQLDAGYPESNEDS